MYNTCLNLLTESTLLYIFLYNNEYVLYSARAIGYFLDILSLCSDKIAFDSKNCLISYKNNTTK